MTAPREADRGPQQKRFSPLVRTILARAEAEARDLGQNHIGTEHIVLAAATELPFLGEHGVTRDRVMEQVRSMGLDHSERGRFEGEIDYAPRAKHLIEEGAPEAATTFRGDSSEINEYDLVRAFGFERESAGAKILLAIGADLEKTP